MKIDPLETVANLADARSGDRAAFRLIILVPITVAILATFYRHLYGYL